MVIFRYVKSGRDTQHTSLNTRTEMLCSLIFTIAVVLNNYPFTRGQDTRLVNGLDICFGTLEVQKNGMWVTVCDNSWDVDKAALVCRQLGCGTAVIAHGHALFEAGSAHVWLDNCLGNESLITQCQYKNESNCQHNQGAEVLCSASSVVITVAVVVAVLLILFALLIIFLVKRRKKQKKIQICSCSQDAVNMLDVLHIHQNEENADDDYEIVDMDDGDHEDVNSDSEQDYVNVDQDDSEQDYVNVETDNSEQDYVNVSITEHKSMLDNNYEDEIYIY